MLRGIPHRMFSEAPVVKLRLLSQFSQPSKLLDDAQSTARQNFEQKPINEKVRHSMTLRNVSAQIISTLGRCGLKGSDDS